MRLLVIGCDILARPLYLCASRSPHVVDLRLLGRGLHAEPPDPRSPRSVPSSPTIRPPATVTPGDPEPASQDAELEVALDPLHPRLAGQPERRAEDRLGVGPGRQLVAALAHLDDALAAAAGLPARCRDLGGELGRVVEQQVAGHERSALGAVDDVGHHSPVSGS